MIKHKSRKELRIEAATSAAALANLQSPEGLAGLVFEKSKDREFHVAFREALENLYDQAEESEEEGSGLQASGSNPEHPEA